MLCFGEGKKEENSYDQEGQWGHRQKVVDGIALHSSPCGIVNLPGKTQRASAWPYLAAQMP